MNTLSPFWSAASSLSGAVDFSILNRADPTGWTPARLAEAGIPRPLRLFGSPPLHTEHTVMTLADMGYPLRLAPLPYAPPVLFFEGNLEQLKRPGVAIVGARKCTAAGKTMARELAMAVVRGGGTVISGMAYGIDTAAHLAACENTIAVLGQGLDVPFSSSQARLRQRILDSGGLLVSEFPPDYPASRRTFPLRNRIIAWLARATVVVEATRTSGALHTARASLDAGLDVLAVPGHPHSPIAAGCLALIDQGAEMVRSGHELLVKVALPREPQHVPDPLLEALQAAPTFGELLERLKEPAHTLARRLALMELTGVVERLPGDRYALPGAR